MAQNFLVRGQNFLLRFFRTKNSFKTFFMTQNFILRAFIATFYFENFLIGQNFRFRAILWHKSFFETFFRTFLGHKGFYRNKILNHF